MSTLRQLHAARGLNPAVATRREAIVGRLVDRLVGVMIFDDGSRLSEYDTSSSEDDEYLGFGDEFDGVDGTSTEVQDSTEDSQSRIQLPHRTPIVIDYAAEDELEETISYYALRDVEENMYNSNPWSWSEERVVLPAHDVSRALRECVIAFEKDAQPCCICLMPMRFGSKVAQLPCRHLFCKPCVTTWLMKAPGRPCCPICRAVVSIPRRESRPKASAPVPRVPSRHRRWEKLLAEEEEEVRAAMELSSPPRRPSALTEGSGALPKIVPPTSQEPKPASTQTTLEDLEKASPWLFAFRTERRREDEEQRIREGKGRVVPLPRVATLASRKPSATAKPSASAAVFKSPPQASKRPAASPRQRLS